MSVLFAILLFSLLIFVHELGHFTAAKLSGVQVNEFAIFMGPALIKWQRGETLYSIRCIPFGGYCALEGEDGDSDNDRAFARAAWWKRLIVLVAGSAMNFVIGILILLVVFSPAEQMIVPEIAYMEEGCLLGGENGLQVGDRFLEVDGERIYVQSDFSMILALNGGDVHDLVVLRNGQRVELNDFVMTKAEFPNEDGTTSLRYGFSFGLEDLDFFGKVKNTWLMTVDYVRITRMSLGMLFTGRAGVQDLSGPVGIVQQMSAAAEASEDAISALMNMLNFGAMIAINLAVMNMLPIPALDGGRVVCLLLTTAAEKIMGRKVNPKFEAYLHAGGMILLLALMAVIMFKDIFVIFKG